MSGNFPIELNQSVSANFSICSETAVQRQPVIDPFDEFYKAAFFSAIFIYVVSLITMLANSLLLLTFYVDPLKIFRNSTTNFLIGLAIVDLLTALVQEPIYATCFIILPYRNVEPLWTLQVISHHFLYNGVAVNRLRLYRDAVCRGFIVFEVRPFGDDKEESLHYR